MGKQFVDKTLLSSLSSDLSSTKNNIFETLEQIESKMYSIFDELYWTGKKSESFHQSLDGIWNLPEGNVKNLINTDFDNLTSFINTVINDTTIADKDTSEDIAKSTEDAPDALANASSAAEDTPASDSVPNATLPAEGAPREVSVGGFFPDQNNNENNYVAGLNYQIINVDGTPASDNISLETIKIGENDHQVYTYDDPETEEREHYIIGALLEDGQNSRPTGKVYTIDYGNGDVYEFVDLDTNAKTRNGNEKTPDAALDTYVDILSVRDQAYSNIGVESDSPVKITDTGKTVSKK